MFKHHDILTVDQFSLADIRTIVTEAEKMRTLVAKKGGSDILKGKIMTALFYEPSSRTFGSFITAMQRLGGGIIPLQGVTYSSVSKGETLHDTVQTFSQYSDVVVIRHPEVGAAAVAAQASTKPVINAGDGVGEHPTQALLDFFTIQHHFHAVSGLTVTMVGDMLNGRTIHSLSKLLSLYPGIRMHFVSPEILKLPAGLSADLKKRGIALREEEELDGMLKSTDVLYVTRVQKERFTDLDVYDKIKTKYIISRKTLEKMKKSAIVMHPLPRVGEILPEIDEDPRAVYLREQMRNGMFVRMALLKLLLTA